MRSSMRFLIFATILILLSTFAISPQESNPKNTVTRPNIVIVSTSECDGVSAIGSYSINKGELIEIDYQSRSISSCPPHTVTISTTNNGVLKASQLGPWSVYTDDSHEFIITAWFFKAHKVGHDTITLMVNGGPYVYEIEVQ